MVVHLGVCGGTIEKNMSLKLIQVNQGQKNVCGGTFWCQWSVVVHLGVCGGTFDKWSKVSTEGRTDISKPRDC